MPEGVKRKVDRVIRRSVEYALVHPAASRDFVLAHAKEISEEVVDRHIKLYVNPFSVDLGDEGKRAVVILLEKGRALGIIPDANESLSSIEGEQFKRVERNERKRLLRGSWRD